MNDAAGSARAANRIALVGDLADMREALQGSLASLDCQLEGFGQSASALARAREAPFDLVVSDYRMSGMDGVAMVRGMRLTQPGLVAVVLGGVRDLRTLMNAKREALIDQYLIRPCDAEKLGATVRQALEVRAGEARAPRPPVRAPEKPDGALAALEAKYPGITQPDSQWSPS